MPYKNKQSAAAKESRRKRSQRYRETSKLRIVSEGNNCSGCGVKLTLENHGNSLRCKDCHQKTHKNSVMKNRYGITLDEYNEMWVAQEGCCAICGVHQNEKYDGKSLAVDHDHETGEVRGLLCINCNTGIGHLQDDPDLLLKAVDYIRSR